MCRRSIIVWRSACAANCAGEECRGLRDRHESPSRMSTTVTGARQPTSGARHGGFLWLIIGPPRIANQPAGAVEVLPVLAHEPEAERRMALELLNVGPRVKLVRCTGGGDQQGRCALPDQLLQRFDAGRPEGIESREHQLAEFEDAVGHHIQWLGWMSR